MRALGLIIQREFSSRVKTKTFILTTLLTPLLLVGVMVLPTVLAMISSNDDIKTVYVKDDSGLYANLFESSDNYTFINMNKDSVNAKPPAGTALLDITGDLSQNPKAVTFFSEKQQPPRELTSYINGVLTEAVRSKRVDEFAKDKEIEPQLVTDLQNIIKSKERITITSVRLDETGAEQKTVGEAASVVGFVLVFCMFFFIMMYGQMVVQSVVEEKTNRIIEVIVSSVRPFDLMMGKIIGVGLVGLLQLVVWLVIGGGLMAGVLLYFGIEVDATAIDPQAMGMMQDNPEIASLLTELFSINWAQVVVCLILYFIGGYLLFSSLYAMFGSAANDAQEAQQLMMPLTIILLVAFYAGFAAARNPEGGLAFWCSLIPFTSPVVMMVRAPLEIPLWELVTSIIVLFITAILMVKLAAKIYRVGILMYGKKISFGEMMKWLRYK